MKIPEQGRGEIVVLASLPQEIALGSQEELEKHRIWNQTTST